MQFTEVSCISLSIYNLRYKTCWTDLHFLGFFFLHDFFSCEYLQDKHMLLIWLKTWGCFFLEDVWSYIFKRLLDTSWKTEWQSVCSQFHLKPHQTGRNYSLVAWHLSDFVGHRNTWCFSKHRETCAAWQTLDKGKWSSEKIQGKKKSALFHASACVLLLLYWKAEVPCKSSENLEFTPLND